MSYQILNYAENDDVEILEQGGPFSVINYIRDLSCRPSEAQLKYFMSMQNVTKKQIMCELDGGTVKLQKGAMQWFVGDIQMSSGIKGVGDAVGKMFKGKMTGEAGTKPEYTGTGVVVTEPTYRYYLIEDLAKWPGGVVLEDGMFCACEGSVDLSIVMRDNLSSATLGGEGLFNLCLKGKGFAVLESNVPREELITIKLQNDTLKVDGPYAIAWSPSLKFTVERSSRSLVGSAASGEGLVNVYRGTGTVLMMPQV